jgi:hypothetical protein
VSVHGGVCEGCGRAARGESERGERIVSDSGEKNVTKRMWLWWWAGGPVATYGADMAGSNTSKVEARRRVREAQARANEARAQREKANVDDAATLVVAVGKVSEVDAWETERLAQARDQVRAEANRKRVDHRAEAAAAIARMQQRGETLAMIAELTGASVGEIRALLRHAPKAEKPTAGATSGALGAAGLDAGEHEAANAAVVAGGATAGVQPDSGHAASA